MKKASVLMVLILTFGVLLVSSSCAFAATDGIYNLTQWGISWDGTDARRLQTTSANYDYTYGDEESLSYNLPWPFTFYGQVYNQINIDTNGNIWFASTGPVSSFSLPHAGRGPVISAWNNDLSSYYFSGAFVQHKTNPERVVVEWQSESYTDEGNYRPNDFEVVLFQNSAVRFDYKSFNPTTFKDFGSGISKDDNQHYLNLSATYGNVYSLAGRSYSFTAGSNSPVYPPVVSGSTPTSNPRPTWTWTTGGGGGNGTYRYQFDSETGAWTTTSATSYTPNNDLTAGSHILYVQESDGAGNWSTSGSNSITIISCSYSVSPTTLQLRPYAGQHTINITTQAGCAWTASAGASWINISTGAGGTGSGIVTFTTTSNASGTVRNSSITSAGQTVTVNQEAFKPSLIGVFVNGYWYLDNNGNGVWDGTSIDGLEIFGNGISNAIPVAGDWNGDGKTKIGVFTNGTWYLDWNGNGVWDGAPTDAQYSFGGGVANAIPVTGDWTGTGTTKIGIYANGTWYLDLNGNGVWDGTPTDAQYSFGGGVANAIPVTGDWTGTGTTKIGIYANGTWYLDLNGNGVWDGAPTDALYNFTGGVTGAVVPVTGDWTGTGITRIGVYADGIWHNDLNGNGVWDDSPLDGLYYFGGGLAGAQPVTGAW